MTTDLPKPVLARIVYDKILKESEQFGRTAAGRLAASPLVESAFIESITKPLQDFYELGLEWLRDDPGLRRFEEQANESFLKRRATKPQQEVLEGC